MDFDEYLRRVPKVELHCHFEGTVRPQTFSELAAKHGIALSADDPARLYDYDSIYEFLVIFGQVSSTLIDREDFARTAFESIEDGVKLGNLVYREMFFNPTLHTKRGVPYPTVVDGLIDGCRRAESELGVRCRLIADVYRQDSAGEAADMVREVLEHRREEVIGLGMDGAEAPDPPEKFVDTHFTLLLSAAKFPQLRRIVLYGSWHNIIDDMRFVRFREGLRARGCQLEHPEGDVLN